MAEVIKRQEVQATPEIIKFQELLGMQGRLILADQKYLNPDIKDVPPVDASNPTVDFQNRNYNPFENTSRFDRRNYWQKQVNENKASADFNSQLDAWKSSMVTLFKSDRSKDKIEKLKPFFSQIAINVENFDGGAADTLYSRYFQNGASSVKLFVKDIIKTYDNVQDLKNNLTEIQWLANIFGGKSSEIVAQLVDAEVNLKTDPQFAEKLNQKNNNDKTPLSDLTAKETELLNHICKHSEDTSAAEGQKRENGPLPIMTHEAEIKGHLSNSNVDNIIISAGTGTGKTTKVPVMAMDVMEKGQKMIVTQPRRLPTEKVSMKIREEEGDKIGYMHGKGSDIDKEKGVVCFMTEGTLKRRIAKDPNHLILDIDKIMFDEVHEMNVDLQIDMALALEIQQKRKAMIARGERGPNGEVVRPLQLIFASATSNEEALKIFLPGAEFVPVKGETAKINEFYEEDDHPIPLDAKPARAAERVEWLINERKKEKGRTFIIFMPGDRLIRETVNKIRDLNLPDVEANPLIGYLSRDQQMEAIKPNPNIYNIIVATPIAETSITIEGGVDVISSGLVNEAKMDADTGLNFLEEQLHSLKGLIQQKGRGGRTGESDFIFLGTKKEFNEGVADEARPEFTANPITQSDLIGHMLYLKTLGKDIKNLRFIEEPNQKNVDRAIRQLTSLGALDTDGNITNIGKQMDRLPADPHVARMIIEARNTDCGEAACTIAAMIEATTLFVRPDNNDMADKINDKKRSFHVEGSDFLSLLNIWRQYSKESEGERKKWAQENYLRESTLEQIGTRRSELLRGIGIADVEFNGSRETIEKCIVAGYKDKILRRKGQTPGRNPQITYAMDYEPKVENASITRDSVLYGNNCEMFVSVGNYPRQGKTKRGIIYMVTNQRVDPSWL